MKNWVLFTLMMSHLFVTTEVHQLLRLPAFFSHLKEHQSQEHHSFTDFLIMHYFSGHVADEDAEKDMQLPFKSDHHHFTDIQLVAWDEVKEIWIEAPPLKFYNQFHFETTADNSGRLFHHNIFQPPKSC